MKALIGRKIGMTQILLEDGVSVPVTLIQAGPCVVTRVRSQESDGYQAVALGFETAKHPGKTISGQYKNIDMVPAIVREMRVDGELLEDIKVGSSFDVTVFEAGDVVDVIGNTKGKGFTSTIKRHNMKRGRKTHGGRSYRRIGSIGSMYPQKIFKGKRMAGRSGNEQITMKNLKVAVVDLEHNVIAVTGAIPGPKRSVVTIKTARGRGAR